MKPEELNAFLHNIELFKDLSDQECQKLANHTEVVNYNVGDFLFMENNPNQNVYDYRR